MVNTPMVTVIIPAYRRRNYLFYALDRILAQKDVTVEILVVSEVMEPDEVDEVVTAYPQVKYFKWYLWCCANRSLPGFDAGSTWFSLYASIQIKPRTSNISDVTIT